MADRRRQRSPDRQHLQLCIPHPTVGPPNPALHPPGFGGPLSLTKLGLSTRPRFHNAGQLCPPRPGWLLLSWEACEGYEFLGTPDWGALRWVGWEGRWAPNHGWIWGLC